MVCRPLSPQNIAKPMRRLETNWSRIVEFYDLLQTVEPSPVVSLNRAVAVAMRDGLRVKDFR